MLKSSYLKPSAITLVLMLSFVSVSNESCGVTLPMAVQSTINVLSSTLPAFMGKATGKLTPELSNQANSILASIKEAANLTKGGKTNQVSGLLTSLATSKFQPFLDLWKSKGTLDQTTIVNAIKGVNSTIAAIKRAAKIK